jgi:hypothetical protein
MYEANGPVWYRGWALDTEEHVCRDVDEVLNKTGTRRMIMGHTPDFQVSDLSNVSICWARRLLWFQGIVSRCNGKIIIIDTGAGGFLSIVHRLTYVKGYRTRMVGCCRPSRYITR